MNKFLEKNNKWIIRVFIILGLGLIIKLWFFGLYTVCGGGGWISLCIIPEIEYYWTNAGYIAVVFFLISLFLIHFIKKIENKVKKVKIAFLILVLGIISKPFFLLISDDFRFYLTPVSLQYKDWNGKITDMDKYLELTTKYCDNFKEGDKFHFKYTRETMCGGKFETDFKTVEEYIKVLEYAKNHNFRFLYQNTFRWIDENVGLENVIEKYNDDTFYAYVISSTFNLKTLELIRKKIKNKKITNIVTYEIDKINYFHNNKERYDQYESSNNWNNLSKEIDDKLKKISEINQKIF